MRRVRAVTMLLSLAGTAAALAGCGPDKPAASEPAAGEPPVATHSGTEATPSEPAETADAKTPIALDLPKPLFIGTPKNLRVPNLAPPTGSPRPPFLAPRGVTNVAAGKPVTGSDDEPIVGELAHLTDGEKSGADGTYMDLMFGTQWVQIDLGAPHALFAIVVWHFHQEARVYHDVVVQVADDATFETGVRTLFNNDDDGSSALGVGADRPYVETHEGKLIDAKGIRARYVRLYSRGNTSNDSNHYVEVEVFGKPAE